MLSIAIVEDEESERRHLQECIQYLAEKEQFDYHVIEFSSGTAFIAQYQPIYDIVLMDIEMPGMNGMDAARALRQMDTSVVLVFVTNMIQYAVSGYEVDALSYLLKPINKYDFLMKMHRAVARTTKRVDESIQIKAAGEVYRIRVASIKYLDVQGHYVTYCTTEGNYQEYVTLKEAEQKLNKSFFVRCSRPYLVNLKFVTGVKEDMVLIGGDKLPISRACKKEFLAAFAAYMGGGR